MSAMTLIFRPSELYRMAHPNNLPTAISLNRAQWVRLAESVATRDPDLAAQIRRQIALADKRHAERDAWLV